MALYDHYLIEDREQLDTNLLIMHQALINILKATTEANFKVAENSLIQFQRAYQIVHALHLKKVHRDKFEINEYMRRNYF